MRSRSRATGTATWSIWGSANARCSAGIRRSSKSARPLSSPGIRNCARPWAKRPLRIARAAGYFNLGTLEFLVDPGGNFYFLEVNTRLQVEHPVTELVTGHDLVQLQLKIAAGEAYPSRKQDIDWRGWAMECRVCAEDPENQFFPSPGKIVQLREPAGPNIRLDSGVYSGWTVPLDYDSLLAKLIAWGADRNSAIERLLRALQRVLYRRRRDESPFFSRTA